MAETKNFVLHENIFHFPEERNCIVPVIQHWLSCKPSIEKLVHGQLIYFLVQQTLSVVVICTHSNRQPVIKPINLFCKCTFIYGTLSYKRVSQSCAERTCAAPMRRLSFSGGPHATVNMANGVQEVNVGGKKPAVNDTFAALY